MSVNFQSNPFYDTLLFAGVSINYENNEVIRGLTGEAKDKALNQLKVSYDNYKANLNIKYGQYLNNVEKYTDKFNQPNFPSEARDAVAQKLSELANKRLLEKENHFGRVHKFFHKIGQVFKGHGYRTKAEWGLKVAAKIDQVNSNIYKAIIERCILHPMKMGLNEASPYQILMGMKDEINNLSEKKFKEVLNDIIFRENEGKFFGEKNKYYFYQNLNEEKRKLFDKELLSRSDWYQQTFDIIEGADKENVMNFVSKEMVAKVQSNPGIILEEYRQGKNKNGYWNTFFQAIIGATIKDYLEKENYSAIYNLLNPISNKRELLNALLEKKMLTESEIEKIKSNIKI